MPRPRLIACLAAVSMMVGAAAGASTPRDTAISARHVATIRTIGHDGEDDAQIVILRDRASGAERRLLRSRRDDGAYQPLSRWLAKTGYKAW